MTSHDIMAALAALALAAMQAGDVTLYRSCEALAFEWICAEPEWTREAMIGRFPWGRDIA